MLTDRQKDTFRFIREYHWRNGFAPKLIEIAEGIGIRSKGVVHRYLQAIAHEGLIELSPGRQRGIHLVENGDDDFESKLTLPLLGKIAAGKPIEAIADQNTINLADFFLGSKRFVLKVQGDSMIEAGILDGDMVIVQQRETANDGDIVVALIDNDEATLKRFQKTKQGKIKLIPANQTLQATIYPADRIQIQGVVAGQMRSYLANKSIYPLK